jgi:anti-sigma-K factor RskA
MNGHPTREEDFDLYALNALEGDERQAIEVHVASCAECTRKLADARGRIALLAFAAPPVAPSPDVKQRLMRQVRADIARTAPQESPRDSHTEGIFGRWWVAILAPAAVALAVLTIFLWNQNRRLDRDLAALRASAEQQQQQLHDARDVADLMTAGDTITVALAQQPGQPNGSAHVMYSAKMGELMYEGEIAPAPAAKSYQLWLVPAAGKPISAGVFNPASDQPGHWMMKVPQGVVPKTFAVTLEPAGGMPQPTGPMVLVGRVS